MAAAKTQDASLDRTLHPVRLPSGEVVAWAEAVTRLSDEGMAAVRPQYEQPCRGCGASFPFDPDADFCATCAAENIGEAA